MRVYVAEIADVQDGDYSEKLVCMYLPLSVAAHITVQGTNIAIAIRSPSSQRTSNGNILYALFICRSEMCFFSLSLHFCSALVADFNSLFPSPITNPIPDYRSVSILGTNDDAWRSPGALGFATSNWGILCCYKGA
jgi:hypothetical protein